MSRTGCRTTFRKRGELRWFSQYFLGEQFILATWPDCTAADPRYQLLVRKFASELAPASAEQELEEALAAEGDDRQRRAEAVERVRARQLGDRLGLLPTGDYHENWGGRRERWLQGSGADWYFITPEGELYRWSGAATFPALLWRTAQRIVRGSNTATGELDCHVWGTEQSRTDQPVLRGSSQTECQVVSVVDDRPGRRGTPFERAGAALAGGTKCRG